MNGTFVRAAMRLYRAVEVLGGKGSFACSGRRTGAAVVPGGSAAGGTGFDALLGAAVTPAPDCLVRHRAAGQ